MKKYQSDFLIIGSGIAGLSIALKLSKLGTVNIITKAEQWQSNTWHAQGGIAGVLDSLDSFKSHVEDTLIAGDGLCEKKIVDMMVKQGPQVIKQLIQWGVEFNKAENGEIDLGKEGGHSHSRIVHFHDMTGQAIEEALLKAIQSEVKIKTFVKHTAIDLITEHHLNQELASNLIHCFGVYALTEKNKVVSFTARKTILCTGGAGQVYLHSTNPEIATADGIAMAYRAGARVENLEFMQFHPSSFYDPNKKAGERAFLISEAVRGAGAVLRNHKNTAFMKQYDPRKDLAPRDIVARAIDAEMKSAGLNHVFLDMRGIGKEEIKRKFPKIYAHCKSKHIKAHKDLIPVVPAAHYMCGGVKINSHGETNIAHLYACGEVASSGIHGANRLASNSLLEAVFFAERIVSHIRKQSQLNEWVQPPEWDYSGTFDHEEWSVISHDRLSIRQIMWDYVGIVRSDFRLERAKSRIEIIAKEVETYYKKSTLFKELVELRNLALVSSLIIKSAIGRKESRGLHYTVDYPHKSNNKALNSQLQNS